jgi:hypothetical protein
MEHAWVSAVPHLAFYSMINIFLGAVELTLGGCSSTHKQYTQYSSTSHIYTQTVHTIQQYITHLHKQYTQYSSTSHIYTQTVSIIQR